MSETLQSIKRFYGIDNTSDLATSRFRQNGMYCYSLNNIDIDDEGKLHLRPGYGSAVKAGTTIRSMWANKDICLYLDGTDFLRLNADYTTNTLLDGLNANDNFCYASNGDRVYFSNTAIIGYVDVRTGLPYPFPVPAENHKVRMVGGQILEFYNSRLFAAHGSNLFFSDATIPTRMDQRKNAIAFKSRITMVKSVDDGIYVSDSEKVYFEKGNSPTEFVEIEEVNVPAIEGMSASTYLEGKYNRKVAYWVTESGIYAGYSGGYVTPMQEGLFSVEGLTQGKAIIKSGDYDQFIAIGR